MDLVEVGRSWAEGQGKNFKKDFEDVLKRKSFLFPMLEGVSSLDEAFGLFGSSSYGGRNDLEHVLKELYVATRRSGIGISEDIFCKIISAKNKEYVKYFDLFNHLFQEGLKKNAALGWYAIRYQISYTDGTLSMRLVRKGGQYATGCPHTAGTKILELGHFRELCFTNYQTNEWYFPPVPLLHRILPSGNSSHSSDEIFDRDGLSRKIKDYIDLLIENDPRESKEGVSSKAKGDTLPDSVPNRSGGIRGIAEELNNRSSGYKIGSLQDIRKRLRGLEKKAGSKIFSDKSIVVEGGYAFHHGGRGEIQFNIGFEDDSLFRYGLAFSLEPGQSHPMGELEHVLYPRIRKFNSLVRERPELFDGYTMWYWLNGKRTSVKMGEIPPEAVRPRSFIFFGKLFDLRSIKGGIPPFNEILEEFDKMLAIYLELEDDNGVVLSEGAYKFVFIPQKRRLPETGNYSTGARHVDVKFRHSSIQVKLFEELEEEYGKGNVGFEHPCCENQRNNLVDVVVKKGDRCAFYEVKTGHNAKACIRQAMGQLLEYAFWPEYERADELVVVGEHKFTKDGEKYLAFLKKKFNMSISYRQVKIDD